MIMPAILRKLVADLEFSEIVAAIISVDNAMKVMSIITAPNIPLPHEDFFAIDCNGTAS